MNHILFDLRDNVRKISDSNVAAEHGGGNPQHPRPTANFHNFVPRARHVPARACVTG